MQRDLRRAIISLVTAAGVLSGASAVSAFPTQPTDTNRTIFKNSVSSKAQWDYYNSHRSSYSQMDWSNDGCSVTGWVNDLGGYNFTSACLRHDFGYRNALWLRLYNTYKSQIDQNLYNDSVAICNASYGGSSTCKGKAWAFYQGVSKFAGTNAAFGAASRVGSSGFEAIVFQPAARIYVRTWVKDTASDGKSVAVQLKLDRNAYPDTDFFTILRNSGGNGTIAWTQYTRGPEITGIQGAWMRVCTGSTCGSSVYMDNPAL